MQFQLAILVTLMPLRCQSRSYHILFYHKGMQDMLLRFPKSYRQRSLIIHIHRGQFSRSVPADTLIPNLSVYEMLMYTIELKLERAIPLAEKRAKVEVVMDQLNLRTCQHVRIGNSEQRGISGEA